MHIYISGRMSGVESFNYPAFDEAKAQLRGFGFYPVSPADIGRHYGVSETSEVDEYTKRSLLLADLEALAYCDALYLLPGWESSAGVGIERDFARYFNIPEFTRISDLLLYREKRSVA